MASTFLFNCYFFAFSLKENLSPLSAEPAARAQAFLNVFPCSLTAALSVAYLPLSWVTLICSSAFAPLLVFSHVRLFIDFSKDSPITRMDSRFGKIRISSMSCSTRSVSLKRFSQRLGNARTAEASSKSLYNLPSPDCVQFNFWDITSLWWVQAAKRQ